MHHLFDKLNRYFNSNQFINFNRVWNQCSKREKLFVKKGVEIGEGGFGTVFQGEIAAGHVVLLLQNGKSQQVITKEKYCKHLKEKNLIMQFKCLLLKKRQMEFSSLWNLDKVLRKKPAQQTKDMFASKQNYIIQMAQGVSELHKLGFFPQRFKTKKFCKRKRQQNQVDRFWNRQNYCRGSSNQRNRNHSIYGT
ncbi:unnamed protein product [Paramecium sonneborni]|uniref:Protein kinase domain-containing protein n=1 Tax=Paramecium sonneborni TaxID=65129 RepID=A0A8S1PLH1_9CILI|nr:unnamed protein product [Paramecium sonneborni]